MVEYLGSDALVGVELKQLREDVERILGSIREHRGKRAGLGLRERLEHGRSERRVDSLNVLTRGSTRDLDDAVKLIHRRSAGEHGLAAEELAEDAANRPQVDALGVVRRAKKNLRGAVPAEGKAIIVS